MSLYCNFVSFSSDFFLGETVSSDEFDITLMVNLLRTLANISIVDIYPAPFDASIRAMLTRISYISNKVIKNVEGELSGDQFNQYWDDIGQVKKTKIIILVKPTQNVDRYLVTICPHPFFIIKKVVTIVKHLTTIGVESNKCHLIM